MQTVSLVFQVHHVVCASGGPFEQVPYVTVVLLRLSELIHSTSDCMGECDYDLAYGGFTLRNRRSCVSRSVKALVDTNEKNEISIFGS